MKQPTERMAILPGRFLCVPILVSKSLVLFNSCLRCESKSLCAPVAICSLWLY